MFGLSIAVVERTNKKERLLLLGNKIKTPFLCCKATRTSIFNALKPPCVWVGACVRARPCVWLLPGMSLTTGWEVTHLTVAVAVETGEGYGASNAERLPVCVASLPIVTVT